MKFRYILISICIHIILYLIFSLNLKKENNAWALKEQKIEVNFSTSSTKTLSKTVNSKVKWVRETEVKKSSEKVRAEKKAATLKNKLEKPMKEFNKIRDISKFPKPIDENMPQNQDRAQKQRKNIEEFEKNTEIDINSLSEENCIEKPLESVDKGITGVEDAESGAEKTLDKNFMQTEDGNWAAKNQNIDGLELVFLNTPTPKYPNIARKLGFRGDFIVKVRFLVGLDGKVDEIKFYSDTSGKKYGFESEVKKALSNWRMKPVKFDGRTVKVYFYKTFKFKL